MEQMTANRLYRVGAVSYVQHDGVAPLPAEIDAYTRRHNGKFPPYIPLPDAATEFDTGGMKGIPWDGRGELPVEVMEYIAEHGTLPRRTTDVEVE